ncbi:unannotated protein [freshwater metagenome]|uniref:Unannotated protein n=2 Tax=freshwater metagenome TaxID=449393 RepID=A0A6J7TTZ9_9ZZZZ|nr:magnesium transporter CorA [Actinomycetota bacterium]MTB15019.1 magnesium transporter CorA [Actinomycetota bacterium]MTB24742.1 magnesium transporter CorA [Actinomycetota bacterium]
MLVDCAWYRDGVRQVGLSDFSDLVDMARDQGGFVWAGFSAPTEIEFADVATEFKLHPLAVEDAVHAHQRPKIESYGSITFVVLRTVFYDDSTSQISTGELMCFIGDAFVVIVRHGEGAPLVALRHDLEHRPEHLVEGPYAVLHAVIDRVIDSYVEIGIQLADDVSILESKVFGTNRKSWSQEIYLLKREVIEFRNSVDPLAIPIDRLSSDHTLQIPEKIRPFFRDTSDHLARASDLASGLDALLSSVLNADLAQVQVRQNEDMRKITAWVALGVAPTMVAGIYGMNFDHMPELRWTYAYPTLLLCIGALTLFLVRKFKKSGWL